METCFHVSRHTVHEMIHGKLVLFCILSRGKSQKRNIWIFLDSCKHFVNKTFYLKEVTVPLTDYKLSYNVEIL